MLETCNCRQVHTDFADSIALLRIGALSPRPPLFQRVSHEIVFFADFAESLARNALFQKHAPVSTRCKNGKKSCRVFKKGLWHRSLPCKLRGRRIGFVSFEHLCLFSLRASSRCLVKACNCRSLETYLPKALFRSPKQLFKAIVELKAEVACTGFADGPPVCLLIPLPRCQVCLHRFCRWAPKGGPPICLLIPLPRCQVCLHRFCRWAPKGRPPVCLLIPLPRCQVCLHSFFVVELLLNCIRHKKAAKGLKL